MSTTLTPTLQGSAYALDCARSCVNLAGKYRRAGNHFQARMMLKWAAGYRRVAARALGLERYGIVLAPVDIEDESTVVPTAWRDHTSPTSREREVRVERARKAYRGTLSGRVA